MAAVPGAINAMERQWEDGERERRQSGAPQYTRVPASTPPHPHPPSPPLHLRSEVTGLPEHRLTVLGFFSL
ncbi:hypothetical protein NHX12_023740 [Muraenolepis orangiensis]|uniref:Uncharacterized protein n=1 Tax=Muraenolepis orangiensis TaxID=630683 RepID=A0A9Q0ELN4_9TELE|nr:hypothetical protein NHX12_023740 [Muraenolepis orangiensis]